MGEAKRRKALDPNFGKPNIPFLGVQGMQEFFNKELDLIITRADYLIPETKEIDRKYGTQHQIIVPIPKSENTARAYFVQNRDSIMQAMEQPAQEYGVGWIYQVGNPDTNLTEFTYFPANQKCLHLLENEIFSRSLGKNVGMIMRAVIQAWDWKTCIPVIAMGTSDEAPAWIFLI